MKQLGNLAIICAQRRSLLLQIWGGTVCVFVDTASGRDVLSARWNNDAEINRIICCNTWKETLEALGLEVGMRVPVVNVITNYDEIPLEEIVNTLTYYSTLRINVGVPAHSSYYILPGINLIFGKDKVYTSLKEICDDEEFTVSQCTMEDGIPEAIRPERLNELAKYIHLNRDFLKLEQQAHWFHKLKDWVEENAQWDVSSDFINFYDRRRPIDEYYDYWGCKDKDFDPEVFESSGVANATVD